MIPHIQLTEGQKTIFVRPELIRTFEEGEYTIEPPGSMLWLEGCDSPTNVRESPQQVHELIQRAIHWKETRAAEATVQMQLNIAKQMQSGVVIANGRG